MDKAHHPALFMVDTISSLGSIDYRHDEWGVDVTIAGSQEGADASPGMSFNAISGKALAAVETPIAASYWDWQEMLKPNRSGFFPYTPPPTFSMDCERHCGCCKRKGWPMFSGDTTVTRKRREAAVRAWGLEIVCEEPREYSSSLTGGFLPEGHDADKLRAVILENF